MWVKTIITIGTFAYGIYSKNKAGEAQDRLNYANYQRQMEQYSIDLSFNRKQNEYANSLQSFAEQTEAWGLQRYAMAQASRAAEVAYRAEQVANQKFAATVDYKAQVHVADILQSGATQQATQVVDDILRTHEGNKRDVNVRSEQAMGTLVATHMSGVAQGASKERLIVDAFRQRNKAIGQSKSKAKASMIQTINQKNKVINDTNLQTAASYRGLQAIMKLQAAPVAMVPPPMPVNTLRAPVAPIGAAPIQGGNYVPYNSGATYAAGAASMATTAVDVYTGLAKL